MRNIMNMKSILVLTLTILLCAGLISGCEVKSESGEGKYSIVCTIFPEYDWVREIISENSEAFDITLLLDNGVDLHSYQPTAEDIMTISTCDLFIYVGGESDAWVREALKESVNKDMKVINLLEVLGDSVKEEEIVEGMEREEKQDNEAEEELEYDEHVWLSIKNAQLLVSAISGAIEEIDSGNQDQYRHATENYLSRLDELDRQYSDAIGQADKDTLVIGDRFPFRYLVDDYHIKYFAAFSGCSAETEASFDTIIFLAGKLDEEKLNSIIVTESSDKKIARTIIDNTKDKKQNILVLDSMQSATNKTIRSGITYISVMEKNLEVIQEALE